MRLRNLLLIAVALLLATLPGWASASVLNILTKALIAGLFATSFNLLWGQAGLLSFGQAAYYGIGAFAAIYAMGVGGAKPLVPLPLVPLVGAFAGLAIALVAGWFATMRSGIYFAMITFAFAELINAVAYQWDAVFGGESGVRARRIDFGAMSFQSTESVYWLTLFWLVVALLAVRWLQLSPFGQVMKGLREREDRLAFIGYDTHLVKTATFCIAAAFSGLAGALIAITNESANVSLLASHESTNVVLNTIIGGSSMFFGPMLGAAFMTLFGYYAAVYTTHWPLYLGLIFVAVVLFAPQGIGGVVYDSVVGRKLAKISLSTVIGNAVGVVAFVMPTVLLIEIIGHMTSAPYAVARRTAGGGWPLVHVFGIEWTPFSPQTILLVAGSYAIVFAVRRFWLGAARKRVAELLVAAPLTANEVRK